MELLSVAMETQQKVPAALLSSYKIFHAAANNIKALTFSCNVPDFLSDLKQIWIF
jgi:hypothetical protein